MSAFRLRTFGGLSISRDGNPVSGLTDHPKTLAMLAVIAASGAEGIGRERLTALLWPESDTARARGALKQMLHFVRRQLDDPQAVAGIGTLSLDQTRVSSDVADFRTALVAGDDHAAVALYTGAFLDAVHIDESDELERWISVERDRLERSYADARDRVTASASANARSAEDLERTRRQNEAGGPIAQAHAAMRLVSMGAPGAKLHLDEAFAYFTRALAIDPKNARGLCGLGNWHYVMAVGGYAPRDEFIAKGREMIFSALAADLLCAEVHCSLAKLALYFDDDLGAALRYIRRSLELDPHDAEALRVYTVVSKTLGSSEDAVNAAKAAVTLAPETPGLWNTLGDALLSAGRNSEAVDALKHAVRLRPGFTPALERLERAYTAMRDFDKAVEIRKSRLGIARANDRADQLVRDARTCGPREALRRDIERELESLLHDSEISDPFEQYFTTRTVADRIVTAFSDLEKWKEAVDWVERAYESRPGRIRRMLTDLPLDRGGLASDPRYLTILSQAGAEDLA